MLKVPEAGLRRRIAIIILIVSAIPAAAIAQYATGAIVQPLPRGDDPAERLAQALRTLAVEPNNVEALTVAGHNALALGDPNAAVGFLGRAGELAPRDGRVKAGLGSALVQLEKPQDALRLFSEASALGVRDADLAEDRGLAYDLTGDSKRAQRDYATALAANPEDDTARRRLALSQGIAGNRVGALATLDPLIRRRDIAGWRAQTFVLAMTGDTRGASEITHVMMPQQAEMLQPFLVRLANLSPIDKAKAVHFGEMPAAGRAYTPSELASTGTPATYAVASPAAARGAPPRREARVEAQVAAVQPSDLAPITRAPIPSVPTPTPPPTEPVPDYRPAIRPVAPNAAAQVSVTGNPLQPLAPLAGIALSPVAGPSIAVTNPASAPTTEVRPATPSSIATVELPPSTPPTPVAPTVSFGHYDLPRGAAARAPIRPAPRSVAPVTAKTEYLPETYADTFARPVATVAVKEASKSRPVKPADVAEEPETRAKAAASNTRTLERAKTSDDYATNDSQDPMAKRKTAGMVKAASDEGGSGKAVTTRGSRGADTAKDKAGGQSDRANGHNANTSNDGDDRGSHARGKAVGKASSSRSNEDDSGKTTKSGKSGSSGKADASDSDGKSGKRRKGGKADTSDSADNTEKSGQSDKLAKSHKTTKSDKTTVERVYVQVAGGANRADMDKAWEGVKMKAPDLMKGHVPSTTPLRATNRLLVGPFKSDDEAQMFVNKMAAKGLSGFTFKSAKGQKVEKVDSAK